MFVLKIVIIFICLTNIVLSGFIFILILVFFMIYIYLSLQIFLIFTYFVHNKLLNDYQNTIFHFIR